MFDLKSLLRSKTGILICISLLCAILLLFIGSCSDDKRSDSTCSNSISEYESDIESRLKLLISSLNGVGEVEVMVVLDCGGEYVYAQNTEVDQDGEKSEYFTEDDPLLLKERTPEIKGVAVVCEGGDDYDLQTKIIELVSRSLDLSSGHIFVGA